MLPRIMTTGMLVVIAFTALASYTMTGVLASPCNLSGSLNGVVVRPPQITTPVSSWSFSITNSQPLKEVKGVTQGALEGTFSAPELSIIDSTVSGKWSYNKETGKLLIMLSGSTYKVDIAMLKLPSPGFTFSGTLHIDGKQPAMLVKEAGSISCA